MSLSVCCIAGDPGPRVVAALAPFRGIAEEIVVAADARVGEDTLAHYAAVADRLYRVEVAGTSERHLAWLHAQCTGDWILRLDGDEVASSGLIERVPELIARHDVVQYRIPRRWLYPDADHWLEEQPWWPDHQIRLVRNDGLLRFQGLQHSAAELVMPARYLEEPIYHLAFLVSSEDDRRAKAEVYELRRPGLPAAGGGGLNRVLYLPEKNAQRSPSPVPPGDRAAIAAALGPGDAVRRPAPDPPLVSLAESDVFWAQRPIPESAYAAEIGAYERSQPMFAGEHRALYFRFRNEGTERWPWGLDHQPLIRASYRWFALDGSVVDPNGHRTPFPCEVLPGDEVIVPLFVTAPSNAGTYVLEVDVVHELVRWFESGARFEVTVLADDPRSG